MRLLVLLLALSAGGCIGETYRAPAPNPFPGVKRVAVAPFLNRSADLKLDGKAVADAFASELLMHPGFQVFRPAEVAAAAEGLGIEPETADDYLEIARKLGADAIVVAAVTETRSYYPPRTTVALQLLVTQRVDVPDTALEEHIRSARPLPLTLANAPNLSQQFETVCDGGDDNIRSEVKSYAAARVDSESPWQDGEGVLRAREPWLRFVCALLVERVIDTEAARRRKSEPKRWHDAE